MCHLLNSIFYEVTCRISAFALFLIFHFYYFYPMLVKVFGSAVYGVDAITISIEVDTPGGTTGYFIVGLPDNAVKESTERVLSAIKNTGLERPRGKIVVN